jgi:hypothetical protein
VKQLALGYDDDVKARRDLVTTENLSNQSFGTISLNRAAQFLRGGDAQTTHRQLVAPDENGAVPAADAEPVRIDLLEVSAAANPLGRPKSLYTASRLRPFARRRLSTSRPFLVLMRTRNPCVRLRWRVFGWNVRFPFMRPLHAELPANRSLSVDGCQLSAQTLILTNAFQECQSYWECATVGVLRAIPVVSTSIADHMRILVSSQSFPHLWKKLWKIAENRPETCFLARNVAFLDRGEAQNPHQIATLWLSPVVKGEK